MQPHCSITFLRFDWLNVLGLQIHVSRQEPRAREGEPRPVVPETVTYEATAPGLAWLPEMTVLGGQSKKHQPAGPPDL